MRGILDSCRRSNVPVRTLPSLAEMIDRTTVANVSQRDLRSPRIEDLLHREEVPI